MTQTFKYIVNSTNNIALQLILQDSADNATSIPGVNYTFVSLGVTPDKTKAFTVNMFMFQDIHSEPWATSAINAAIKDATNSVNLRTDINMLQKAWLITQNTILAQVQAGACSYLDKDWGWSLVDTL